MNLRAVQAIISTRWPRLPHLLQASCRLSSDVPLFCGLWGSDRRAYRHRRLSYGAFIVPGLIMLAPDTKRVEHSFAIYFPKFVGTIYESSAPISASDRDRYVGAAATRLCSA
jgi:ABC-2 type transport system permease protein